MISLQMPATSISVLVVDDEPDLSTLTKNFLEMSGDLDLDTASSVREAIDKIIVKHYEAIVSDYQMPDEDGLQFLKLLRSRGDNTPFILFTGRGREEVVIEALNSGADFYLQKGGNPLAQFTELEHKIKQAVRRKRAEESLRQREERYKSVLLTAPDIIITVDRDLRINDINHPIHPNIDSIGKNLFEFIDPDFHARVEEELERVFTLGVNGHYELVGQGVDEGQSWYETNIGPIFENGTVTSAVLVIRVITERKRAEISVKESEERFRSLSENAFEGIGINIDGVVVDANKALSDILGYAPNELMGMNVYDFLLSESRGMVRERIRNNETGAIDVKAVRKNGDIRLLRARGKEITWKEKPARLSAFQDITESWNTEEALRESEERHRILADNTLEGIIISVNGTIIDVNRSLSDLIGCSPEMIMGMDIADLFTIESGKILAEKFKMPIVEPYAVQMMKKNGDVLTVEIMGKDITWKGRLARLSTIRDITDRKKSELVVRQNNEELQSLNQQMAGAEEELRQQLDTIIQGNEELGKEMAFSEYLMDSLPGIFFLYDAHSLRLVRWNKNHQDVSGYSQLEMLGKHFLTWIRPENAKTVLTAIENITKEEKASIEAPLIMKDGSEIPFLLTIVRFDTKDRSFIMGVGVDITEVKRAEEISKASRERFETLFFAYNEGVALHEMVFDEQRNADNYRILEVNPAFERMTTVPREMVIGKLATEAYGTSEAPYLEIYSKVALTGEPTSFETFFPPLNKHFSISAFSPARGQFATVFMDITERKQFEERLGKSEERYRTYVDHAIEGVFVTDEKGYYRHVNQAACRLVGYTEEELLNLSIADLTPPDEMEIISSKLRELKEQGTISIFTELRRKNGSNVPVYLNAVRLPNGNLMAFCTDITEKKREDDALKESEERFRTLFEGNGDATWVIDQRSVSFIDANPAALKMYGYSKEEFSKLDIYDVSAEPEKTHQTTHPVQAFIPLRYHKRKDGTVFPVEIVSRNSFFDGRQAIISTARDITERLRAERELKENETRYRSLFQNHSAPMLLIDPANGTIVDVNLAACEYYGYERKIFLNKNISQINILTAEDTKEEMRRSVLGEKRKFDFQHRLSNGDVRDVEVYSSPVYLNEKPYLYSIIHDVTERRRIEKALQDNEEKFREIFDHANDAIHLHVFTESGAPGCFIDVNEVACRMLGYTHEEMIQIPPLDLSTDYHDPPMDNVLEELRLKGRARFETEHRRKDGSIVPVEINAHVVNHQGSKMTISVVRDISENKRINDALKLASEKLNLLSSITRHDINNQIVAIKGHLELLKLKHPELEFNEHLRTIDREAGQISSMIRFTKEYEDIGVHAPIWQNVRRLVELVSKDILLQSVKVVDDIPESTAIFADPLTVKVFRNLIQNALRHGGRVTTIHFFIEDRNGDLAIVCEDDGDGIRADMKDKLFTKGFGNDHGLGLFLSREILAITGIKITEEGITGKGAKFVMTVPQSGINVR